MLRKVLLATFLLSAAIPVLFAKERILVPSLRCALQKRTVLTSVPYCQLPALITTPRSPLMGSGSSLPLNVAARPDIYRVHPNGSGLERLTDDPAYDDQADLSPDGKQLALIPCGSPKLIPL